ncbi:MAG: SAM-dependent methyltransferase, partial [Acidimicrobiia bacterium]|nr:SAM-dependent methyltransferase [Acidimicrobiia bacterium]
MEQQEHWDRVYGRRASEELGWYEPTASTLQLVLNHSKRGDAIVDVGAGDSRLADDLLCQGYDDLTLV